MKIDETNLGYLIETPTITALFGGQKSQLLNLKASFPKYEFIRVKQTHGDQITHSTIADLDYQVEADAHYTEKEKFALCISTADCIPALIYDSKSERVAAVHAGWRGVANQIVPKTLKKLISLGTDAKDLHIVIGPHIQMKSFEVEYKIRDEILQTISAVADSEKSLYHENISAKKSLVDLNQVLKTQLLNCAISHENIFDLHIDTFTDLRFHSFRRDKEKSGRQLSFICRN